MSLPNEQRAANDAYWTPDAHALAICWHLRLEHRVLPETILEPCVGGGAWVRAARMVWPHALIDRWDVDASAPGLNEDLKTWDRAFVRDFREPDDHVCGWDLILGNPPYGGDLRGWIDLSLQRSARWVAYLLRDSFTGSAARIPWLQGDGRPTAIVKVLPRPKWGGPGARGTTDMADSALMLWDRRVAGTSFDWLDIRQPREVR